MSYVKRFLRFWWNFIVGDDLPLALGAGATIGLAAILVHEGVNAWWLLPTAVLGLLAASVALKNTPTAWIFWLRNKQAEAELQTRNSFTSPDQRAALANAPEALAADTRVARFLDEGSMADVERLGD